MFVRKAPGQSNLNLALPQELALAAGALKSTPAICQNRPDACEIVQNILRQRTAIMTQYSRSSSSSRSTSTILASKYNLEILLG